MSGAVSVKKTYLEADIDVRAARIALHLSAHVLMEFVVTRKTTRPRKIEDFGSEKHLDPNIKNFYSRLVRMGRASDDDHSIPKSTTYQKKMPITLEKAAEQAAEKMISFFQRKNTTQEHLRGLEIMEATYARGVKVEKIGDKMMDANIESTNKEVVQAMHDKLISGYILYYETKRPEVLAEEKESDISCILENKWKALTMEDKENWAAVMAKETMRVGAVMAAAMVAAKAEAGAEEAVAAGVSAVAMLPVMLHAKEAMRAATRAEDKLQGFDLLLSRLDEALRVAEDTHDGEDNDRILSKLKYAVLMLKSAKIQIAGPTNKPELHQENNAKKKKLDQEEEEMRENNARILELEMKKMREDNNFTSDELTKLLKGYYHDHPVEVYELLKRVVVTHDDMVFTGEEENELRILRYRERGSAIRAEGERRKDNRQDMGLSHDERLAEIREESLVSMRALTEAEIETDKEKVRLRLKYPELMKRLRNHGPGLLPKPATGKLTRYEEPQFAPQAEAELALQRDCLDVIETVEAGGDAAKAARVAVARGAEIRHLKMFEDLKNLENIVNISSNLNTKIVEQQKRAVRAAVHASVHVLVAAEAAKEAYQVNVAAEEAYQVIAVTKAYHETEIDETDKRKFNGYTSHRAAIENFLQETSAGVAPAASAMATKILALLVLYEYHRSKAATGEVAKEGEAAEVALFIVEAIQDANTEAEAATVAAEETYNAFNVALKAATSAVNAASSATEKAEKAEDAAFDCAVKAEEAQFPVKTPNVKYKPLVRKMTDLVERARVPPSKGVGIFNTLGTRLFAKMNKEHEMLRRTKSVQGSMVDSGMVKGKGVNNMATALFNLQLARSMRNIFIANNHDYINNVKIEKGEPDAYKLEFEIIAENLKIHNDNYYVIAEILKIHNDNVKNYKEIFQAIKKNTGNTEYTFTATVFKTIVEPQAVNPVLEQVTLLRNNEPSQTLSKAADVIDDSPKGGGSNKKTKRKRKTKRKKQNKRKTKRKKQNKRKTKRKRKSIKRR